MEDLKNQRMKIKNHINDDTLLLNFIKRLY